MAFGFGFNKQKVLSSAEKFVQQGKLQNAIAEYDKVLKNDAKDLTVNNTIGDLYARLGDRAKAIECFKKVGDAYAAQGFTVKGIAMYKKITKLQASVDSSLKLAELYTQQGLFNDARAQYLQVAEDFTKSGDFEQAVRIFQKVLEMDPENVPMRVKLAEVYVKIGKKKEAWEIFSAVAELLRSRGSLSAADDILNGMLALEPGNSYVLLLRGKAAFEGGDFKKAINYLEMAADLDSHPDGLRDLLKSYLQIGNLKKAAPISEKLLTVHNDPEGLFLLAEGCMRLGQFHEALDIYTRHADHLLAIDSTKLLASLHTMITHVRDDSGALDSLLRLLNKAGESTHVNEVTELLAHASVEDGNLTRARDLYQMLSTTEPQNTLHMQNYQQVLGRMASGTAATGITAEEGALIVEELETTAPVIEQSYADDVAIALRSAVTDADLFISYNLPDKAVVPLLAVLPKAPGDVQLNQRLAALHTRFHRFAEAAGCCRALESIYREAGHPDEAVRYGDLAARYDQNAATTSVAAGTVADPSAANASSSTSSSATRAAAANSTGGGASAPWPTPSPVDAPQQAPDLTSEWERLMAAEQLDSEQVSEAELPAAAEGEADDTNPEIAETVDEIRFYCEQSMMEQARARMEKLETLTSDPSILDPARAILASAEQAPAEPEPEVAVIEITDADTADIEAAVGETAKFDIPDRETSNVRPKEAEHFETATRSLSGLEIATSPDLMTGYDHQTSSEVPGDVPSEIDVNIQAAAAPPEPQPASMQAASAATEHGTPAALPAFVADLEASLGDSFPMAPPAAETPAHASPAENAPAWPAPKRFAASAQAETPAPVSANEMEVAAAATPSITGSAAGSAAAAAAPAMVAPPTNASTTAPAMTFGSVSVRPLGGGAHATSSAGGVDLSEMFGELKQELEEEVTAGADDPETHYNLGVAFREMGLLDEAIAEFQKVCSALDQGKEFSQPVQSYTWLAQCFLDKGVPEAAVRWYERALGTPGLDQDGRLAITYELGSACESAQDRPAALRYFTEVYGANIDYRDVAERIQSLKS